MSDDQNAAKGHRPAVERAWALEAAEVVAQLQVNPAQGLAGNDIHRRRNRHGPNRLRQRAAKSAWRIFLEQFKSIIVVLLALAAGVSLAFHDYIETVAIAAVILINAAIGFFTELRAVRSMEALRRLGRVKATVRRDGQAGVIPADELVAGDIVLLEGGDIVSADLRLIEASKLQADESPLTGESVPVAKTTGVVAADAEIGERENMLFKGTSLTRGSGLGIVVATGLASELGAISRMVEEAHEEVTPLEKRLESLGRKLVWLTLLIAAVTATSGILSGKDIRLMIETAIALAVAAIPEGLPIVATIALARGMWRMAQRNALVNRLSAVETLGGTTLICTDKTGTLTEDRMTVVRYELPAGPVEVRPSESGAGAFRRDGRDLPPDATAALQAALEVGALCNNASLSGNEAGGVGDPLEVALLRAAEQGGIARDDLARRLPEVREEAFDSDTKMMGTFHSLDGGRLRVAVKGAAEAVLEASSRTLTEQGPQEMTEPRRQEWLRRNEAMAAGGLRVLALAGREDQHSGAEPYADLTFIGLVGLLDPPRMDVRDAIAQCRRAGVRVVMVTGDQPATAAAVAREVGLLDDGGEGQVVRGRDLEAGLDMQRLRNVRIFARVSPRQKFDLVGAYQASGEVVAMTGDGVNDAPALKKADIGVAMGQRGTEVAREAADMVLKDDAFASIVAAVHHGRVIFNNIRNFVLFLMSCNLSEIVVVALASLVRLPLPVLPLQILFLNLVTDVFPALALGMSRGDADVMTHPPRNPLEPVLTRRHWLSVAGYGGLIALVTLGALIIALFVLGLEERKAVTVSFLVMAMSQLWHVFNMRSAGSGFFRNEVTTNPSIWGAVALCVLLLLAAVYLPGLSDVLGTEDPGLSGWALVVVMSLIPWAVGQTLKTVASGKRAAPRS